MSSGSRGMARRRSNTTESEAGNNTSSRLIGGTNGLPALEIANREPTRSEIVAWLAKKRDNSPLGTVKEKLQKLKPIVDTRKEWIDRSNRLPDKQQAKQIADNIAAVVPPKLPPLRIKSSELAELIFDVYISLKAFADASRGHIALTRTVASSFDPIEEMVLCASAQAATEIRQQQEECLHQLSAAETRRQYLQDGFQPKEADRTCFFCKHVSIDCPNSNKSNQVKYNAELRDWRAKKEEADKEARRSKTKVKLPRQPKKPDPYFQCHCNQFRCLGVSDHGSSCPIKCINPSTGSRYPMDSSGCTCPLCNCKCCAAYGYNTRQAIAVKRMLDSGDLAASEELKQKKSQQFFSFITNESVRTSVNTFVESAKAGKKIPAPADMNNAIRCAVAQSTARLDPQQHPTLIRSVREALGAPTTRVQLPVAIQLSDGTTVNQVDTRVVGTSTKRDHRARNNGLDSSDNQNTPHFPVRPYEDASMITSSINSALQSSLIPSQLQQLQEYGTGSQDEFDHALAESQSLASIQARTQAEEERQLQEAIRLSASLDNECSGTTTRSPIIIVSSPSPAMASSLSPSVASASTDHQGKYRQRVMKRAHGRAMMTTEVENLDDPSASPEMVFTSPHAAGVLQTLGDEHNTYLAKSVDFFHEDNPLADSQEGYSHARNLFKAVNNSKKPAKKQKKGSNN